MAGCGPGQKSMCFGMANYIELRMRPPGTLRPAFGLQEKHRTLRQPLELVSAQRCKPLLWVQPREGAEMVVPWDEKQMSLQGIPLSAWWPFNRRAGRTHPGFPQAKSQRLWAAPQSLSKLNSTQKSLLQLVPSSPETKAQVGACQRRRGLCGQERKQGKE